MLNGGLSRNGYQTVAQQPSNQQEAISGYTIWAYAGRSGFTTRPRRITTNTNVRLTMSIKLMTRIWDEAPYSQTTLLVLLCLADMANDDGVCWPSVETIARRSRVSPRWVRDVLVELETAGWVGKEPRAGQTTRYHLHCPPLGASTPEPQFSPEETSPLNPSSAHPGTPDQGGDEPQFRKGGTPVQPNHKEPSIEPSLNLPGWLDEATAKSVDANVTGPAGLVLNEVIQRFTESEFFQRKDKPEWFKQWAMLEVRCKKNGTPLPVTKIQLDTPEDLESAFMMFWEAYPKQERIVSARAAFKTAVAKTDPLTLITKAKGYARVVKRDGFEPRFVANPAQWLADERWRDNYPSAAPDLSRTAADY